MHSKAPKNNNIKQVENATHGNTDACSYRILVEIIKKEMTTKEQTRI